MLISADTFLGIADIPDIFGVLLIYCIFLVNTRCTFLGMADIPGIFGVWLIYRIVLVNTRCMFTPM